MGSFPEGGEDADQVRVCRLFLDALADDPLPVRDLVAHADGLTNFVLKLVSDVLLRRVAIGKGRFYSAMSSGQRRRSRTPGLPVLALARH
jgi:hypothetical protein